MNYYEHHLGDYLRDTAHLSMLEDGAYRRLLEAYYIRERPLPKATKDICRLARATTKAERDVVQTVLAEFFEDTPEGWRQRRCDSEIRKFNEKAPDREARRENERDRQRRTRERRKQLFELLREHGIVPAYDTSTTELQSLVSGLSSAEHHLDETSNTASAQPVTPYVTPVTHDTTATHTPVTNHQTQQEETESTHATADPACAFPAAQVCMALKQAGIGHVNPGDPRLLALLARGATVANFLAASSGARDKRNPFAYLLATIDGQLTEAASLAAGPRVAIPTKPHSRAEQRAATIAALTGSNTTDRRDHAERKPSIDEPVDVESHVVG